MDVQMYKIMDEIMEIMHQITAHISEYIIIESGTDNDDRTLNIENDKILKSLFLKVQELYKRLSELIYENNEEINTFDDDIEDIYKDKEIVETIFLDDPASNIDKLKTYLEEAYTELRYITLCDKNGNEIVQSIYKDTGFESIRNAEYNIQQLNLDNIDIRHDIQSKSGPFSFKEKSYILEYMAEERFYKGFALEQLDKYIEDLNSEESNEEAKKKILEQKYILYYTYLNNKYNGLLQQNDNGRLEFIKKFKDDGAETILLNMTRYEIDENIRLNMQESKDELKEIIKDILKRKNIKPKGNKKTKKNSKQEKEPTKSTIKNVKESFEEEER